jgi:hypothetical protein
MLWVEAWAVALTVLAGAVPWRCSFEMPSFERPDAAPAAPSAAQPKQEASLPRVTIERSPGDRDLEQAREQGLAPVEAIALPEEVVIRAIAVGQPAFLRCWARAQRTDLTEIAAKVRVRLEVDAAGKVAAVASDCESPVLSRCLAVVARQLPFPAPGRPALVELPLLFR